MLLYGLDIETDNSEGHGLDSRFSRVTSIAISAAESLVVIDDSNEERLLRTFGAWLMDSRTPSGVVVTWNGSGFDLPFLADRSQVKDVPIPLTIWPDDNLKPKYPSPNPVHTTGYRGVFGRHHHVDICYAYQDYAIENGVKWSLKPVAESLEITAFVEDATKLHETHPVNRAAYNASDAHITRLLAEQRKELLLLDKR